jgi:hypothetical protein
MFWLRRLASGLPACPPIFPACRALSPDETGLLVPTENPIALAQALERLIRDPCYAPPQRTAAAQRCNFDHMTSMDTQGTVRAESNRRMKRLRSSLFQHLLGIGHLARASRAAAGHDGFDVTVVTGGAPIAGFPDWCKICSLTLSWVMKDSPDPSMQGSRRDDFRNGVQRCCCRHSGIAGHISYCQGISIEHQRMRSNSCR